MAEQTPAFDAFIASVPPDRQAAAKDEYFARYVAPNVAPEDLRAAKDYFDTKAVLPEQPGFFSELYKGTQRGLATQGQGLAGSAALAAQATGDQASIDRANQMVRQQAADMRAYSSPYSNYENVHGLADASRFAGASIGEVVGNVLPTAGIALASGPAAPVTGLASIAATTAGNQYAQALGNADDAAVLQQIAEYQKQNGTGPLPASGLPIDLTQSYQNIDKGKLATGTAASAGLEALGYATGPVGKLLFRGKGAIGKTATDLLAKEGPTASRMANAGIGAVKGGAGEAGTEYLQEYADEYGAGNQDWLSEQTHRQGLQAAASAAVGGGFMGGVGGAYQAPAGSTQAPPPGPSYEDQLRAEGIYPEQGAPAAPQLEGPKRPLLEGPSDPGANPSGPPLLEAPAPTEEELKAKRKEKDLGTVDVLRAMVPDIFDVKKKGDDPNTLLDYTKFAKRVEENWKAQAPMLDEIQLSEAYAEAVKDDPTLEFKKFTSQLKKEKLAEYEQQNPKLAGAQIASMWNVYRRLHDQGIRDFDSATTFVNQFYDGKPVEPTAAPTPASPTLPGASDGQVQSTVQEGQPPSDIATQGTIAPTVTSAVPQPRKAPGRGTKIDPETDDLIVAIRRLGGINVDLESDFKGRLSGIETPKIVGLPNVERTNGKGRSLDDLAEVLHEHGYLASRDVGELYQRLTEAEQKPQWALGKQDFSQEQADNGTDRWIEQVDQANSGDQLAEVAKQAGADPRFQARIANDPDFKQRWFDAVDHAQSVFEDGQTPSEAQPIPSANRTAQPPVAPVEQDLFAAATPEEKAQADTLALAERQKDVQRNLNATQAPQGGGLFDQDNRQTEMDVAPVRPIVAKGDPRDREFTAVTRLKGVQDKGDGIYYVPENLMTPQRRNRLMDEAERSKPYISIRVSPTDRYEFKDWAEVTGNPTDRGYAILDRSVRQAQRQGPVNQETINASNTPGPVAGDVPPVVTGAPQTASPMRTAGGTVAGPARGTDGGGVTGVDTGRPGSELGQPGEALTGGDAQYSQGEAPAQGTTVEAITGILGDSPRIQVHKTLADAEKATGQKLKGNAKAFVLNGKAHFIADRIAPGSELGVFLHEVGAHLGMERILSPELRDRLAGKIEQWAKSGKGVEGKAAQRAMEKAGGDINERIAYFVEEAVNAGVNPTALDMKSDLGRWFRQLWAAMKAALRRFGVKNIDKLTAQDVVNFAYGAARLEMSGKWHGSGQNFNKFSNQHRGTGEGGLKRGDETFTDMIAFGQYFAGKRGTAEWYRDVAGAVPDHLSSNVDYKGYRRVTKDRIAGNIAETAIDDTHGDFKKAKERVTAKFAAGTYDHLPADAQANVMKELAAMKAAGVAAHKTPTLFNVDFNVADDEWLDWDKPLSEQSAKVQKALGVEDKTAEREAFRRYKDSILQKYGTLKDISAEERVEYDRLFAATKTPETTPGTTLFTDPEKFYRNLARELGSEKAASEYLNNLGIKGVRYLDANSRIRGEGTYNYVVFDPKNVVIGSKNSPRIESDEIRYSLQDGAKQASRSFTDALKDFWTDKRKTGVNLLLNPHQIAGLNQKYLSAQTYADAAQAMEAQRLHNQRRIAGLVHKLSKLPTAERNATLELMTRSTLTRVNPDVGLNAKVEQEIDGRKVTVSNEHLKDQANGATAHAKMAAEYRALSPEARKIYSDIRNHFADTWAQRIETVKNLANETDVPASVRNRLNKDMDALKAKVVGPYFPLMREGRFAVVWKSAKLLAAEDSGDQKAIDALKENKEDYWVQFTDSESDAKRLSTERPEGMAEDAEGYYKIRTVLSREADGASSKFMTALEEALGKKIADTETRSDVLQSVRGVFLETLPELSVMRRTVMRHRVNGVKAEDMMQSIARAGIADAHYLARTTHMGALTDALSNLKKEDAAPRRGQKIDLTTPGTPKGGIGRVYEVMLKSFQGDMLRPEPNSLNGMASKLVGLSYLHSLALDAGNLVANVLQPQMTAAPLMGARFGLGKTEGAMITAFKDAVGAMKFGTGDVDVSKLPEKMGERQAISTLIDQGMIELSQSRELAMVGRGALKNPMNKAWTRTMAIAGWASHNVETFSRLATTLAAYRLELQRVNSDPNYSTKSEQERQAMAVKYASRMSNEALGNYTPGGAPLALRGNHQALTRLALQFKRYAITMLYLYGKTARDAVQGDREAQKSMGLLLGFQFAIGGGLAGLPVALPAQLIAALFPGEDDDESEEEKLDRLALEVAGGDKKLALALRKGPLTALTGIDWGRKMGLQDVLALNISGARELAVDAVAEGRRMVMGKGQVPSRGPAKESPAEWAVDNLIPSASSVDRLWHGMQEISNGYLADGIVSFLPKNPFIGLYTELYKEKTKKIGMTNKSGTSTKLAPEAYSDWDIFAKAIGMPLTIESEAWANAEAFNERKQPKADRRASLLERYVVAKRLGETDKMAELRQDIKAFNESLPDDLRPSMRITEADMISRVQSARKANKQTAKAGGVNATKKERKWARSITKSSPYTP